MTLTDGLYRVSTPGFTAGFVVENGEVTEAAPILRRRLSHWKQVAHRVENRVTNPAFQANFKTGAGYDASLINVYADSAEEFAANLNSLVEVIPQILVVQQQIQAGGVVADALPLAVEQPAQPPAAPPQVVNYPPVAPAAPAPAVGPEVVYDRYQNQYTYNLSDAPALPDGRGHYIRKDWTSQSGKKLKAWVDPSKGPKPFAKGAVDADLIWIN